MTLLFLLIPLVFFLVSSYLFNRKKIFESPLKVYGITFLEAVVSYLITLVFFIQGYINTFGVFFLILVLLLFASMGLFWSRKEMDDDWDIDIETIKNNLILFLTTLLPLYVFLTMFREMSGTVQVLLSLGLAIAVFGLSVLLRYLLLPVYDKIAKEFDLATDIKYFYIFLVVGFFLLLTVVFNFPSQVGEALNLDNNVKFLSFDTIPTDIDNNFTTQTLASVELEEIPAEIIDYYFDGTTLFIYDHKDRLSVYNANTGALVYEELFSVDDEINSTREYYKNRFFEFGGSLVLTTVEGAYFITATEATLIPETDGFPVASFVEDGERYLLVNSAVKVYDVYEFDAGTFTLKETIDNSADSRTIIVITDTLFYKDVEINYLFKDDTRTFPVLDSILTYDPETGFMYSTRYNTQEEELQYTKSRNTLYLQNKTQTVALEGNNHHRSLLLGDNILFVGPTNGEQEHVIMMNEDFEITSIFHHRPITKVWAFNSYSEFYAIGYTATEDGFEYLQVDYTSEKALLRVMDVTMYEAAIDFPFYAHYSVAIIVPIVIAMFVPMTDYREHITVISAPWKRK